MFHERNAAGQSRTKVGWSRVTNTRNQLSKLGNINNFNEFGIRVGYIFNEFEFKKFKVQYYIYVNIFKGRGRRI